MGAVKKFNGEMKESKDESLVIFSEKDVTVEEEIENSNASTHLKFNLSQIQVSKCIIFSRGHAENWRLLLDRPYMNFLISQKFKRENKSVGKQVVTLSTYSQRRQVSNSSLSFASCISNWAESSDASSLCFLKQLNFLCDFLGSKGLETQIRVSLSWSFFLCLLN